MKREHNSKRKLEDQSNLLKMKLQKKDILQEKLKDLMKSRRTEKNKNEITTTLKGIAIELTEALVKKTLSNI